MPTNSDRLVLYGGMALIAWLLYRQTYPPSTSMMGVCAPPQYTGPIPEWVRQLASEQNPDFDYFTPQCGMFGRCQ